MGKASASIRRRHPVIANHAGEIRIAQVPGAPQPEGDDPSAIHRAQSIHGRELKLEGNNRRQLEADIRQTSKTNPAQVSSKGLNENLAAEANLHEILDSKTGNPSSLSAHPFRLPMQPPDLRRCDGASLTVVHHHVGSIDGCIFLHS